jgi:hypothetical protein
MTENSRLYRDLTEAVNSLKSIEIEPTATSRRHLAALCREELLDAGRRSWTDTVSRLIHSGAPALSGALGLVLVATVTILFFPRDARQTGATSGPGQEVRLVSVESSPDGAVTLEWQNGKQRVYRVLKSTDPRDFRGAEAHAVRGNRWTDRTPAMGEVVYYKVE